MAGVVTALAVVEDSANTNASRVHAVVAEHYDFVWRSLRRLGVTEAAADDEAQRVFCVFARRESEVPDGKEKTFLFGVVIRVAQASRRITSRRAEVNDDERLAAIASDAPGADALLDEARARALLDRLLMELPMELRTVFVLYEIEELTMAEIATMLALPAGTVASRLRRARAAFQALAREAEGGRR